MEVRLRHIGRGLQELHIDDFHGWFSSVGLMLRALRKLRTGAFICPWAGVACQEACGVLKRADGPVKARLGHPSVTCGNSA